MRWCPIFSLLFACTDAAVDDTAEVEVFCDSMATANQWKVEAGGADKVSGLVYGRLITDQSDDPRDPNFVAFVEYTLKNTDVGGVQIPGESDVNGDFVEMLGAGAWEITIAAVKNGWTCNNKVDFEVAPDSTTWLCLDMQCL
jgi:hypothetical protein